MHFYTIHILAFCLISINSSGQTTQYKPLLDSAIKFTGNLFVSSKPITKISLDEKDLRDNYDDLKELYKNVDTIAIYQILKNSKSIDTLFWTDAELDKFILVQNREQDVQLDYAIHKFNLTEKKKLRYFREQINQFNSVAPANKNIYYYSKPVFDNSK